MKLETERLILRPTNEDDAAFLLELLNSPKWLQNIGDRNIRSIEDAKAYVRNRMYPQFNEKGYSSNTVILKSDGSKIGTCGLYHRPGLENVDIGFAFLPDHEGKGYGYEAATKVMHSGIHDFGIKKICAITLPTNIPSQKLLEKLGLVYSKTIHLPNDTVDLILYEWENKGS
jgi:[ribosomal protein S5]-alanine N-acetyltransferase